jgi:hypothetical protein
MHMWNALFARARIPLNLARVFCCFLLHNLFVPKFLTLQMSRFAPGMIIDRGRRVDLVQVSACVMFRLALLGISGLTPGLLTFRVPTS